MPHSTDGFIVRRVGCEKAPIGQPHRVRLFPDIPIAPDRQFGPCRILEKIGSGGMGRAYVMASDKSDAKKCYDRFFTEWKDADPDIPDLIAAKKEYAAL